MEISRKLQELENCFTLSIKHYILLYWHGSMRIYDVCVLTKSFLVHGKEDYTKVLILFCNTLFLLPERISYGKKDFLILKLYFCSDFVVVTFDRETWNTFFSLRVKENCEFIDFYFG